MDLSAPRYSTISVSEVEKLINNKLTFCTEVEKNNYIIRAGLQIIDRPVVVYKCPNSMYTR